MAEGGMLSPEEIESLLASTQIGGEAETGGAEAAAPSAKTPAAGGGMDDKRREEVFKRCDAALASGVGVAGILLGKELALSPKGGGAMDPAALSADPGGKAVAVPFSAGGGKGALLVSLPLGAALADLMMGGDATSPPDELDELYLSALKETASQVVSAAFSSLSQNIGGELKAECGDAEVADLGEGGAPLAGEGDALVRRYDAKAEGLPAGEWILVLDALLASIVAGGAPTPKAQPRAAVELQRAQAAALGGVTAVQFPQLTPSLTEGQMQNIELLLDVPMHITVELGRTTRMIREVLNLGTGSIIELDKLAGEPVDLLVNGKLIAKGEVVVIDESFGVRITEIVSPVERIAGLSG